MKSGKRPACRTGRESGKAKTGKENKPRLTGFTDEAQLFLDRMAECSEWNFVHSVNSVKKNRSPERGHRLAAKSAKNKALDCCLGRKSLRSLCSLKKLVKRLKS
jgi:hypothetical protein